MSTDALVNLLATWTLPVLLAVTLHEAAHAYVARALGDDTAARLGRVTLNPLRHVDRFGTIILPALLLLMRAPFMLGWAKPVPVDYRRLRQPKRDMALVALAGPAMNLLQALVAVWLLRWSDLLPAAAQPLVAQNLVNALWFNTLLAVFNMLPLPPLDGGRVAVGLLPPGPAALLARTERYGIGVLLLVALVLPLVGRELGVDLNIIGRIVLWPTLAIVGYLLQFAGLA